MSAFQVDFLGNLDENENNQLECDAIEGVLSSYVATEAKRNRRRRRRGRGRGRFCGNDVGLWVLLLRAAAMGAARDGVVARRTAQAFTHYVRGLSPQEVRSLVLRLHAESSRRITDLPSAA